MKQSTSVETAEAKPNCAPAPGSAATRQWETVSPPSICGKPAEYKDASGKKLCKRHGEYIKNRWPESVTKLMPLNADLRQDAVNGRGA